MNIIARAPFKILRSHGVPAEQVEALEQRFGPVFPMNVSGPDDAMVWALTILPWPTVAKLLRPWLLQVQKKGDIVTDRRAVRALEFLIPRPDADAATALAHDIQDTLSVLARVRGIKQLDDHVAANSKTMSDDFRAWAATLAAVAAAHTVTCREHTHEDREQLIVQAMHSAIEWTLSCWSEETRTLPTDKLIRELVEAVADFVGQWVGGSGASN